VNGRAYKVMLYLGCVVGVYAGAAVAHERGLDASRFALVTIALLVPAFVGSRVLFVLRHADVYRDDRRRVIARSEGGAALFGGLVVAIALSVPVLHLVGLPFWTFWDAASITMVVGLFFTRFGCLMNGCCAGRPTDSWLGVDLPNVSGHRERRYPTQLLEAAFASVLLVFALVVRNTVSDGALFAGIVVLYCAARLPLQTFREHSHTPQSSVVL
jgi:phosphatidylglycerol:prolipoprotein diacylglycerol transferase